MNFWLLKTEADGYPIEQLEKDRKTPWSGVRNFKARNYMKDEMRVGDLCLFYHTGDQKGVYGLAKVASASYPDPTQFEKNSDYFEPKATKEKPYWYLVDIAHVETFKAPVLVTEMKVHPKLADMMLWSAPRLSIQPVSKAHFDHILSLARA